jgi:serine/threonine protein kinase
VIGPLGSSDQSAIKNEIRVIDKLLRNQKHRNIITVLSHDWFIARQFYYIDMELCAFDLHDFVQAGIPQRIKLSAFLSTWPQMEVLRCFTLYGIMDDITSGLQFIHTEVEMHQDLKPNNGMVMMQGRC